MAKRIGEFLMELGILSEKQVTDIVRHAQASGLRFGEAAIHLGILQADTPIPFPGLTSAVDFFHLRPEFFPKITQELFTPEEILKLGVLPLGYKSAGGFFKSEKVLNLGFLDPSNQASIKAAEALAHEKVGKDFAKTKTYLVLADEFLNVMESVYHVSEDKIRHRQAESVDSTLRTYLSATTISPS